MIHLGEVEDGDGGGGIERLWEDPFGDWLNILACDETILCCDLTRIQDKAIFTSVVGQLGAVRPEDELVALITSSVSDRGTADDAISDFACARVDVSCVDGEGSAGVRYVADELCEGLVVIPCR